MDPERWTEDHLLAGWNERADRVLMLGLGADARTVRSNLRPPGSRSMVLVWDLEPGAAGDGWLLRPYSACAADLPGLRRQDWEAPRGKRSFAATIEG